MNARAETTVGETAPSAATFHHLVLYRETFELPSRYEPELDVLWPGERQGTGSGRGVDSSEK